MDELKTLIGDGSTFERIILRSVLERLRFKVVAVCKDSQEVLDKYVETKPDLVLVDLMLTGMDCVTLIHAMTTENPSAIIFLLVPEGSDDSDVIVAAVRAGIKGYFRKPLSAEEIEARMGIILKREDAK